MSVATFSAKKDGQTKLTEHFSVWEWQCHDESDEVLINLDMPEFLERFFSYINAKRINITSGYRTPEHSVRVGGYSTDQHTQGNAVDITAEKQDGTFFTSAELLCALEDLEFVGGVGRINRENAVHIDVRGKKVWFDEVYGERLVNSWYDYLGVPKQPKSGGILGIDVSEHNGYVDYGFIKNSGIDFVIIRAGYGRYPEQVDKFFEENYKKCRKNNIPVGSYWYSYAETEENARKEARLFIDTVKGKQFEYPLYYDIEESRQFELGSEMVGRLIAAFCDELEKAGYYAGVYCSQYYLQNLVPKSVRERYDVWVAQYADHCTYTGTYGMWQKSSTHYIGGKQFDLDECYVNYPAIIENGGFNGFKKDTVPGDINGDGKVDAADARLALRIAAKLDKATPEQIKRGDMDGDGKISAKDAQEILKKAAKLK